MPCTIDSLWQSFLQAIASPDHKTYARKLCEAMAREIGNTSRTGRPRKRQDGDSQ